MKVVQKSTNGKMLKLQDSSFDRDTWFFLSDDTFAASNKYNVVVGTEIEIKQANISGNKTITELKLAGATPVGTTNIGEKKEEVKTTTSVVNATQTTSNDTSKNTGFAGSSKWGSKDASVQESIIRQSTMKCASEAVRALEGQVSVADVADVTIAIYRKLLAVINE